MSAIRSAESNRESTCEFADVVCRLSISEFQRRSPVKGIYKQTVLSTFLIQFHEGTEPVVVSLGVGTKIVPRNLKYESRKGVSVQGQGSAEGTAEAEHINCEYRVRDCHAEVLARRGLKYYLLQQLELLIAFEHRVRLPNAHATDAAAHPAHGELGYSHQSIFELIPTTEYDMSDSYDHPSKEFLCNQHPQQQQPRYRLRPGVSLHMYSSSQPCGNACIKRWAKSKAAPRYPTLNRHSVPTDPHPRFFVTARSEGQVAALCKRDSGVMAATTSPHSTTAAAMTASLLLPHTDKEEADVDTGGGQYPGLPAGVVPLCSELGSSLSCSDKIAIWNALGVQGALLAALVAPVYVSSVTVGRKFSKVHCQRAICCRLQDFVYPSHIPSPYRSHIPSSTTPSPTTPHGDLSGTPGSSPLVAFWTHHPVVLCTGVKFDESAIVTDGAAAGAQFSEPRCLVWSAGRRRAQVLDGRTGLVADPAPTLGTADTGTSTTAPTDTAPTVTTNNTLPTDITNTIPINSDISSTNTDVSIVDAERDSLEIPEASVDGSDCKRRRTRPENSSVPAPHSDPLVEDESASALWDSASACESVYSSRSLSRRFLRLLPRLPTVESAEDAPGTPPPPTQPSPSSPGMSLVTAGTVTDADADAAAAAAVSLTHWCKRRPRGAMRNYLAAKRLLTSDPLLLGPQTPVLVAKAVSVTAK